MTWTPERIEELTQLWNEGLSASAIGKKIGVSKNAVVGKAHRLGLPPRPSPIRKDSKSLPPRRREVSLPVSSLSLPSGPEARQEEVREPLRRRDLVRQTTCAWPIGDPAASDFHFCGQPSAAGKPYCAEHCAQAYVAKREKESEAA